MKTKHFNKALHINTTLLQIAIKYNGTSYHKPYNQMKITKYSSLLLMLAVQFSAMAQNDFNMADAMYDNGKIYVVVGVLMTIFTGIIAYLVYIDKKLKKLEQKQQES